MTDDIVAEMPSETGRDWVRTIAFSQNDALPKRKRRPTRRIEYLVEQLYLARDSDTDALEDLLRFTLLVQEYYDITDDIIDGDVAHGKEAEVFITHEYLMPVLADHVGRLGPEARSYWCDDAVWMVECFTDELTAEPSAETYFDILTKQANLFGSMTGTCGVVAGADRETVERYAAIGTLYFELDQLLLDGFQYGDEAYPWNVWSLLPEDEALARLRARKEALDDHLETLPTRTAERVKPLIAVDLDTWVSETVSE
ncbi:hypothetical protein HZS55_17080 [Halosimplex rubrum]|uniref:Squalene/phytoene synthase family protein n=1 Tax=Halosimplex rubrum TaxID=869889 RepID=A0A7D5PC08_9EURY|nr:hypothetical protein [Halosimplex rubrum]QLH78899.1 hypothetical protein HZS55_17080 [Halosimplex rubrum]